MVFGEKQRNTTHEEQLPVLGRRAFLLRAAGSVVVAVTLGLSACSSAERDDFTQQAVEAVRVPDAAAEPVPVSTHDTIAQNELSREQKLQTILEDPSSLAAAAAYDELYQESATTLQQQPTPIPHSSLESQTLIDGLLVEYDTSFVAATTLGSGMAVNVYSTGARPDTEVVMDPAAMDVLQQVVLAAVSRTQQDIFTSADLAKIPERLAGGAMLLTVVADNEFDRCIAADGRLYVSGDSARPLACANAVTETFDDLSSQHLSPIMALRRVSTEGANGDEKSRFATFGHELVHALLDTAGVDKLARYRGVDPFSPDSPEHVQITRAVEPLLQSLWDNSAISRSSLMPIQTNGGEPLPTNTTQVADVAVLVAP
jgi:hypothetical protein